jgi:hypothetical protein
MKRTLITSILMAAFLLVSACSSHRYTVVEPRKKELTDYSILEIRDFKSIVSLRSLRHGLLIDSMRTL